MKTAPSESVEPETSLVAALTSIIFRIFQEIWNNLLELVVTLLFLAAISYGLYTAATKDSNRDRLDYVRWTNSLVGEELTAIKGEGLKLPGYRLMYTDLVQESDGFTITLSTNESVSGLTPTTKSAKFTVKSGLRSHPNNFGWGFVNLNRKLGINYSIGIIEATCGKVRYVIIPHSPR